MAGKKIYDEAQRLITLVGDVMEISRLDEGITEYKKERVDLLDVVEDCKERLQEAADRKEIQVEVIGQSFVFETTKTILEEVVYNLMDNAIKYNKEQGKVTVRIFQKDGEFGFSVKDTGIGIPLIHQDRIFERFYRVDKSRSKEIGGTGLGLSIVKHGVSCLGAKISVDSIQDEGSTFTVTWADLFFLHSKTVTIWNPLSREVFWHEYAKIPRVACKNPIAEGDFHWIFAHNCEVLNGYAMFKNSSMARLMYFPFFQ